jgi:hypothetical protein
MPPSEPPIPTMSQSPPRPPLGYCIAAILITWMGLLAAGLNLQWTAAPPVGDALRSSWLYTNIMLGFLWLLFWPAATLRGDPRPTWRSDLFFQWLAMLIGAVPALSLAAYLSATPANSIRAVIFTQGSFSIFAAALIALAKRYPRADAPSLAAFFLAAPATVGPVLYFLLYNFFGTLPTAWSIALPPMCIARAAQNADPPTLITAAVYLLTALLLFIPALRK